MYPDKSERLRITNGLGEIQGEIKLMAGWFSSTLSVADSSNEDSPRWELKKKSTTSIVLDRGIEDGNIELKRAFSMQQQGTFIWKRADGQVWSAVFTSNNDYRAHFTIKFYRGLPQIGGPSALVALADGGAGDFILDISDPSGLDWYRLALGALWLVWKPQFPVKKLGD